MYLASLDSAKGDTKGGSLDVVMGFAYLSGGKVKLVVKGL